LSLISAAAAADWPQFRGPGSQGVSEAKNLPLTWSDTENLLWKTELPGSGASSPIAIGGKLYVTCYSGYGMGQGSGGSIEDLMLHVVCVDASSGGILWDTKVPPRLPESKKVRDHGYAAPTPASDGKHLYIFFGKSGVFKFDLNGTRIWQAHVGNGKHVWGCGTSPVLHNDLVIVNASVESGDLVAFGKETGKEVWRTGGMRASWNTPHLVKTADGKTELLVSVKNFVLGFDPDTGKELWRCGGVKDYVCPSIVSADGIAYAIGGRSSQCIAVRTGGRGNVTGTHKLWEKKVGANVSSPVVHGNRLFWVSDRNRTAYCLDRASGDVLYAERFRGQPYASTLVADGKLYVVTRRGGTAVLAAKPEFEELARNRLSDRSQFNASPIVAGGNLILRSDSALYCVGSGR